jgi:Family of unknown function (DUF6011)
MRCSDTVYQSSAAGPPKSLDDLRKHIGAVRRRLRGYSRHKCRRCGAPLKDWISIKRGYGHECWRKVHGWDRPEYEIREHLPRPRVRGRRARPPAKRLEKPMPIPRTPRSGWSPARELFRNVVVGVSCAAFPAACPAIIGVSRIDALVRTGAEIVRAVNSGVSAPVAVTAGLVGHLIDEAVLRSAGPYTRSVSQQVATRLIRSRLERRAILEVVGATIPQVVRRTDYDLTKWGVEAAT